MLFAASVSGSTIGLLFLLIVGGCIALYFFNPRVRNLVNGLFNQTLDNAESANPVALALQEYRQLMSDKEAAEQAADQVSGDVDRAQRELTEAETEEDRIENAYKKLQGRDVPNKEAELKKLGQMYSDAKKKVGEKTKQLEDARQASEDTEKEVQRVARALEKMADEIDAMKSEERQAEVIEISNKAREAARNATSKVSNFAKHREETRRRLDAARARQRRNNQATGEDLLQRIESEGDAEAGLAALESQFGKSSSGTGGATTPPAGSN